MAERKRKKARPDAMQPESGQQLTQQELQQQEGTELARPRDDEYRERQPGYTDQGRDGAGWPR